jgi:hypothetical protein
MGPVSPLLQRPVPTELLERYQQALEAQQDYLRQQNQR